MVPVRWTTRGSGVEPSHANHANHGSRWNSTTSNPTKTHETTPRKQITTLDHTAKKQEVPVNPETGKPYINTLAAVAISPAGASPEKSTYVAQAVDVIRESGLPNETNAMFTNIEGDIDDVLKVIRDATMKLAGQGYRTDVVIRLDIRPGFEGQIHAKQELVNEILSK